MFYVQPATCLEQFKRGLERALQVPAPGAQSRAPNQGCFRPHTAGIAEKCSPGISSSRAATHLWFILATVLYLCSGMFTCSFYSLFVKCGRQDCAGPCSPKPTWEQLSLTAKLLGKPGENTSHCEQGMSWMGAEDTESIPLFTVLIATETSVSFEGVSTVAKKQRPGMSRRGEGTSQTWKDGKGAEEQRTRGCELCSR